MSKLTIKSKCPNCDKELMIEQDIDIKSIFAPNLRCRAKPVSLIGEYHINLDLIKSFIVAKSRQYVPDVKIEIASRYCERKRNEYEAPHSYASLKIAFSDDIIERRDDNSWYSKIGENGTNLPIYRSLMEGIINKYKYDKKYIEIWLDDLRKLEKLENGLGITKSFIQDIQMYNIPQRVTAKNGASWIIFSAAPEKVIKDMFTDSKTQQPCNFQIKDTIQLSKDNIEYIIHVYPNEVASKHDPFIRQLLFGEDGKKK